MELGIGHHGEPGIRVADLSTADEMAAMCVDIVLPELSFAKGDRAVVLVSGLGATPVMELYIYYSKVAELLEQKGVRIHRPYVGNYFTSLDMMGVTLTVMKVDDELAQLVDMAAESMGLTQLGRNDD